MRRIVISITDNVARNEVETGIELEESAGSTEREDKFANMWLPKIIAALTPGAKICVVGDDMDEIRDTARTAVDVQRDIEKAGE